MASTMRPMSDRVRDSWGAGEVALNALSMFGGGSAAGVLASAGFDAVTVDLQHGEQTLEGLGDVVGAPAAAGVARWARVGPPAGRGSADGPAAVAAAVRGAGERFVGADSRFQFAQPLFHLPQHGAVRAAVLR